MSESRPLRGNILKKTGSHFPVPGQVAVFMEGGLLAKGWAPHSTVKGSETCSKGAYWDLVGQ